MSGDVLTSVLTGRASATDLSPRTWEQLLSDARRSLLVARLAHQAIDQGWFDRLPARPRRHLEAARRQCAWQQDMVRWELGNIERALAPLGIPVVLLKGAAYVMAGVPVAKGRIFEDIDIMVPRDRIVEAEAALVAQGWRSHTTDAYDQQYYRNWMHEIPPLHHVLRSTVIDLHHTISPPMSRTPVDARKLFAAARPLDGLQGLSVLAPADMLLHSAIHLMQEGEIAHGLRDLTDLDALFRDFGCDAGFWPALLSRAAEHNLGRPLYYAVQQTRSLLGTPMPAAFVAAIDAMRPGIVTRRLMGSLLKAALLSAPARRRSVGAGVSCWLLYMRGHYMRMPLRILIPHLIRKSALRLAALGREQPGEPNPAGGERTGAN